MWFGDGRGMQEASEDGGQIEAAIETVLNFGEIAMSVFGEIERVVGSSEGGLQIAEQGIDGMELLKLDAGRAAAGDGAVVRGAAGGDGLKTPQAVRDYRSRGA